MKFQYFVFLLLIFSCGQKLEEKAGGDQTLPLVAKDNASTNSSEAVTVDVSKNDTDPEDNLDTSTVTLGVSIGGSCDFDPKSPFVRFTPDVGFSGTGSCAYSICDDAGNCSDTSYEVVVFDTNPPTANTDFGVTSINKNSAPINVATNDEDLEGAVDLASIAVLPAPAPVGGICAVTTSPNIVFTPDTNFIGTGTCSYRVCDKASPANCTTGNIEVTIEDSLPPVVTDDAGSTDTTSAPFTIDPSLNDTDPGNNLDPSSVLTTFGVGGNCVVTTAPTVQFTPNAGFSGQGSCGYKICDTLDNCSNGVILVTVNDTTPPTASADSAITTSGVATSAINVSSNDFDLENNLDITSVTVLGSPVSVGGICALTASPSIVFTPTAGFSGAGSCSYQICDHDNNCSQSLINVDVQDKTPPVVVNDSGSTDSSGTAISEDVSANDSDAENNLDPSSVTLSFSIGGTCTLDPSAPTIKFTPTAGYIGNASCGYRICDTANNCSQGIYDITVTDGVAPTATNDIVSTNDSIASQPVNVSLNDFDPERNLNPSSVTIDTNGTNGSCAVTTSPSIVYTPNANYTGSDSCVYEICDNANNCSTATLNIQVNDSSFPIAINDSTAATSAQTVSGITFDVAGNDTDAQGNLDSASVTLGLQVGGTCSVSSSPNVQFIPTVGFIGNASCGYQICDLDSNCSSAILNILVTDANAPTASADSHQTNAGTPAVAYDVSANDTDIENNIDSLSVSITATPAVGGSCAVANSPLVQFTPTASFVGDGTCEYEICDNANNCSTATLTVTVQDAGSPLAINDNTSMSTSAGMVSFDVLANDSDPENNLDSSTLAVLASNGGSCIESTPNLEFTPDPGVTGQGSCTYQICDTSNNCSNATFIVSITDGNPPIANDDNITIDAGSPSAATSVISNDSDPENKLNTASVTIDTDAVNGTCSVTTSPLIQYTPDAGFSGSDTCTYQVCDLSNNCATADLNIIIQDKTPPVAVDDSGTMGTTEGNKNFDVLANDSDPEGNLDAASLSITFSVGGTCTPAQPNINFAPSTGFIGNASCGYQICDANNNCTSATLSVDVQDLSAPITNPDFAATDAGQVSGFINVAANDIDPEGQLDLRSVTIDASPLSIGGTCNVTNSPFVTFTPDTGFNGAGSCPYRICDLDNNCSASIINITVTDKNPPSATDSTASINQNANTGAIDVSANDSDIEGNLDTTSVTLVTGSEENGSCVITSPNITFTPTTDYAGTAGCDYQICDTEGNCSTASLIVTVNDITPPTVTIDQSASQIDPTNVLPITYTIVFSEPIDATSFTITDLNRSTSTSTGGVLSLINAGNDKEFTLFIYPTVTDGDIIVTIPVGSFSDKNGVVNTAASTSTDNTITIDQSPPFPVTIAGWSWSMSSPNDESFSQDGTPQLAVSGITNEDGGKIQIFTDASCITFVSSEVTIASGSSSFTDINYATDGSEDGEKIFYASVTDSVGNVSPCTPVGLNYTLDNIEPTVVINQNASQGDPTKDLPIIFEVFFSEEIDANTFDASDITNTGTAIVSSWEIVEGVDSSRFTLKVTGMDQDGEIIPTIGVGAVDDFAGNSNVASTSTDNNVEYDSTPPLLTIVSAPTINLDNDQAWPIHGTCGEVGEIVEVVMEPGNVPGNIKPIGDVICQPDMTWSTVIDTRSLSSDGTYDLQITHVDGVGLQSVRTAPVTRQADCTSAPDAITDVASANITQQTVDLSWITPAENGTTIIDYVIEFREDVQGFDWVTFPHTASTNNFIRVTSLNINAQYQFRVRAIGEEDLGGGNTVECFADFSNVVDALTKPQHPFFDPFDFELVNLTGAQKSLVAALDDTTEVRIYGSFADYQSDTRVETINLDRGETALIDTTTAAYSGVTDLKGIIAYSVNPIYISGALTTSGSSRGNPAWLSPLWAEKELSANIVRANNFPAPIFIRTFEAGTNIDIFEGTTLLTSITNVGSDQVVQYDVPNNAAAAVVNVNGISTVDRSFKITSNKFVAATTYSSNAAGTTANDDKPFLPQSRKLLGVPSRGGFIGTTSTSTVTMTAYHSDGTVQSTFFDNSCVDSMNPLSLTAGSALVIMPFVAGSCVTASADWRDYKPEVVYLEATESIAGNNVADAAGANAAPFIPVELKKRRYIVPAPTNWVVFASDKPADITRENPDGSTVSIALARTGVGPFDAKTPYRVRLTGITAGTIFEGDTANDTFVGWYEPIGNGDGFSSKDETILVGYE